MLKNKVEFTATRIWIFKGGGEVYVKAEQKRTVSSYFNYQILKVF